MVYVIHTAKGLNDLLNEAANPSELWLNGEVAISDHVSQLRATGWNVTIWTHRFEPTDQKQLANALTTVREHHPNKTIWLEQP
jgi:hypothetical protein